MADDTAIIDFDNPKHKQMLMGWLRACKGPHKVKITKVRQQRSLSQNSWYWACIVPAIKSGIEDQWGEPLTLDETHEFLKARFLQLDVVNHETGEVVGTRTGSSAALNTKEFSQYIEQIIKFAGEYLGVEIPPAESFNTKGAAA